MALKIDDGTVADRDIEIEVLDQKIIFTVGPDDLSHVLSAYDWLRKNNLLDSDLGVIMARNYNIVSRVKAWQGIELKDGSPAPCNEELKLRFFGKFPDALHKLQTKIDEEFENEIKNLETSQDG